ncbi:MAG: BamA/TamA family outer membrane protein [Luteibaculaceae bacterium]
MNIVADTAITSPLPEITYQRNFRNVNTLYAEIDKIMLNLKQNGHFAASIDSITNTNDSLITAYIFPGKAYQWISLKSGNIPEGVLSMSGFREKLYQNKPFGITQFERLSENIVSFYENNGYPFAAVSLDSININDNEISASLNLTKNTFYKIDSVIVKGEEVVAERFLLNYLNITLGMPYSEQVVRNIERRLQELPFLRQVRPFEVFFSQSETKIYLYLERQQASNFNGVVGFLPNEEGEVTITGDLTLRLQNALKKGEIIGLAWRRLQTETQELNLEFNYPFLFNSPLGTDFDFRLFRADSTFIELDTRLGVRYIFKQNDFFRIFYRNQNSTLLRNQINVLDGTADFTTQTFGIGFQKEKLDYRFNPTRGHFVHGSAGFGNKRINRNPRIDESFYEDLEMNSDQYTLELRANLFLPLFARATIRFGFQGAHIENNQIFLNEMHRIGGVFSLRGADEQSIFASTFAIGTAEFRYLLEKNSYFMLFFDQAYYENRNRTAPFSDTPLGFGTGISFETNAGIFSIVYALGRQFDNPIDLRAGKIHFGFSSLF